MTIETYQKKRSPRKTQKKGPAKRSKQSGKALSADMNPEADMFLVESSTLPAVPGAFPAPMPHMIEPMLTNLVDEPFSHPEWLYEVKWDGVRALFYIQNGQASFISRNGIDMSFRYPELAHITEQISAETAILDGEIVALNEKGLDKKIKAIKYRSVC